MSDPRGSKVSCTNSGGFEGALSARWKHNGQQIESATTDKYFNPNAKTIDLMPYASTGQISTGDSVWLCWHMVAGPNKESGDNVTFDAGSDANVNYTITGGVDTPSFHQQS
jgi:hypothetical protein